MKKLLLALALGAMAVAGCGGQPSTDARQSESASGPFEIAVIPKALTGEPWKTIQAGADAAGKETGATIVWAGPS